MLTYRLSYVQAMCSGDDPVTIDYGTATSHLAVKEEQRMPRPRMRHRLISTDRKHDVARMRWRRFRLQVVETVADPNVRFGPGNAARCCESESHNLNTRKSMYRSEVSSTL